MVKKAGRRATLKPCATVYLVDGSCFLYRAYYGLRPLHTPQGIAVQAVYSFCRMLRRMIEAFEPMYLALVWDSAGPTERHSVYAAYKAQRQERPQDLWSQRDLVKEFADIIGLRQVEREGCEADDLMYSLARDMSDAGMNVVIVTSDKDMAQALDEHTALYDPAKDRIIDVSSFEIEKGLPVAQLVFYYALVGDASDNIPGVRGIGDQGARTLLAHYASLEDVYEHLEDVKPDKLRTALEEHRDDAFLSQELFRLRYTPLALRPGDLHFDEAQWQRAQDFFRRLNFKSLVTEEVSKKKAASSYMPGQCSLIAPALPREGLATHDARAITTKHELEELCQNLRNAGACSLDTETDGIEPLVNACVGISCCFSLGQAFYIPFGHVTDEQQLDRDIVVAVMRPVLEDPSIKKYFHNAKFDLLVLRRCGIDVAGFDFDSALAARLLLKEWQRVGLKSLSEFYFNEPMMSYKDVASLSGAHDFSHVPLALAARYSAADAHQTYKLVQLLKREFEHEPTLAKLYFTIEHPLVEVIVAMESEGIILDCDELHALGHTIDEALESVQATIKDMIGIPSINLNSPRQIEHLLFDTLGLPPLKKNTKAEGYCTDHAVLEKLAQLHPVPGLIMHYRELFKLKNTYIDVLPTHINQYTGRIHTTFRQLATATGRLASSDPNLQNIPTDGVRWSGSIRAAFKPQPGHVFIAADYSQIELRVLAFLSRDAHLIDAFVHGRDIHTETAAHLFQVDHHHVSREQRKIGKRVNFSILFGMTPYGLAKDLGIPQKDAKTYIDGYFARYPHVSLWMERVVEEVKATGFVETLWGRRRYIPTIFEKNHTLRQEAHRLAINTKVQGTAADLMKLGMVRVHEALKKSGLDASLVLQIHDEILVTVSAEECGAARSLITRELETVVAWDVPLVVTAHSGASWQAVTQ